MAANVSPEESLKASLKSRGLLKKDRTYLDDIRRQPCLMCAINRGCESHHFPHKKMGGGGDWSDYKTVPLCMVCHLWWHKHASRAEREKWHDKFYAWMEANLKRYWDCSATPTVVYDDF